MRRNWNIFDDDDDDDEIVCGINCIMFHCCRWWTISSTLIKNSQKDLSEDFFSKKSLQASERHTRESMIIAHKSLFETEVWTSEPGEPGESSHGSEIAEQDCQKKLINVQQLIIFHPRHTPLHTQYILRIILAGSSSMSLIWMIWTNFTFHLTL